MMSISLFKNLNFPSFTEKLLALLAHLIFFLGEDREEMNVVCSIFRVQRQLGFDQRVSRSFPAEVVVSFNNLF